MSDTENKIYKISDGDYEILFSSTFNVYEKKFTIGNIGGFTFVFQFEKDPEKPGAPMEISGNDAQKTITVKLFNFYNPLGMGTTKMIPILKLSDGRQIYFSLYAKSLNETTDFLSISLTFYLK